MTVSSGRFCPSSFPLLYIFSSFRHRSKRSYHFFMVGRKTMRRKELEKRMENKIYGKNLSRLVSFRSKEENRIIWREGKWKMKERNGTDKSMDRERTEGKAVRRIVIFQDQILIFYLFTFQIKTILFLRLILNCSRLNKSLKFDSKQANLWPSSQAFSPWGIIENEMGRDLLEIFVVKDSTLGSKTQIKGKR